MTGVSIQSSLPLILRGSAAPMTNLTDPLRYDLLGIPNNATGNPRPNGFLNQANTYPFPHEEQPCFASIPVREYVNDAK